MTDVPSSGSRTVDVATVRPEDYQELAAFLAGFPAAKARSVAGWLARLRAWWDLNPAFEDAFPRGWVLRDGGRIGGFFGSIPLRMQVAGRETTAFAATSWRVLPEYRARSITLKLRQLQAHKDALNFSTTPLEELVPLLKRLAYRQIDRGPGTAEHSQFILDCEKFWRARFSDQPFGPLAARVAAPVLAALQSLRTRGLGAAASGVVRNLAHADGGFDDLWRRTRTRFANTNVRTAEMVDWYCFAMQPSDKRLLGCYDRDMLQGFMVLLVKDDASRRFAECVDLWIDPTAGEAGVLSALVASAVECARRESFDRVLFPHFDPRTAGLYGRLGLLQGPAWKKREYYRGPPHLMEAIRVDNSYFVRAQGDYGL